MKSGTGVFISHSQALEMVCSKAFPLGVSSAASSVASQPALRIGNLAKQIWGWECYRKNEKRDKWKSVCTMLGIHLGTAWHYNYFLSVLLATEVILFLRRATHSCIYLQK